MAGPGTYVVVPEASAVLVEARSNVGPISFGSMSVTGGAEVPYPGADGAAVVPVSARLEIPVGSLESGNSLYDAELRQRLDERRFPLITAELRAAQPLSDARLQAEGDVTIHGATRRLRGTVAMSSPDPDTLVAEGREVIDVRDFEIGLPSVLLLKIYPDVTVQFRVTARRAVTPPAG